MTLAAVLLSGCADGRVVQQPMEPTIRSGGLVTIDEDAYDHADPRPGDIVRLRTPGCPGRALRRAAALPQAITIPRGHWFVLGDNRPYSGDSRHWARCPGGRSRAV